METSPVKIFFVTADLCRWAQRCIFSAHAPWERWYYKHKANRFLLPKFTVPLWLALKVYMIAESNCAVMPNSADSICHDSILRATVLLWAPWQLLKKNTQAVNGATSTCNFFFFSEESWKLGRYLTNTKKKGRKFWPGSEKPDLVFSIYPPSLIYYISRAEGSGSGSKGLLTAWINSYLAFRALISSVALIRSNVADYQQRLKEPHHPEGTKETGLVSDNAHEQ